MPLEDFHQQCRAAWDVAVASIAGENTAPTLIWRDPVAIAAALEPFMGSNKNHAHLPTGGGHDFAAVLPSTEPGCLEFRVGERTGYVVKPESLRLERIDSPGNSFLLLELGELLPSGVYTVAPDEDEEYAEINRRRNERGSEELLELAPGVYEEREIWERGFLRYDESGLEVPLSEEARIVVRFFRGSILLVAKGSLWNGTPRTYGGEHSKLSGNQIRTLIEGWLTEIN